MEAEDIASHYAAVANDNGPPLIWSPIQMVPPFNRSPNSGQIVRAYRRPMDAIFMFI